MPQLSGNTGMMIAFAVALAMFFLPKDSLGKLFTYLKGLLPSFQKGKDDSTNSSVDLSDFDTHEILEYLLDEYKDDEDATMLLVTFGKHLYDVRGK